MMDQVISNC